MQTMRQRVWFVWHPDHVLRARTSLWECPPSAAAWSKHLMELPAPLINYVELKNRPQSPTHPKKQTTHDGAHLPRFFFLLCTMLHGLGHGNIPKRAIPHERFSRRLINEVIRSVATFCTVTGPSHQSSYTNSPPSSTQFCAPEIPCKYTKSILNYSRSRNAPIYSLIMREIPPPASVGDFVHRRSTSTTSTTNNY